MVQTFLVVQCHQCKAFQADLEKKAKRWQCKLCGEKQSLQRAFARSHSAKDCRLVVQRYNEARGRMEEVEAEAAEAADYEAAEGGCIPGTDGEQRLAAPPKQPWWQAFQDGEEEDEGWTVAAPDRSAPGTKKRGGGEARGGGKRQRQQHRAAGEEGQEGGGSRGPLGQPTQPPHKLPRALHWPQQEPTGNRALRQEQQPLHGVYLNRAALASTLAACWQAERPGAASLAARAQQQCGAQGGNGWQQPAVPAAAHALAQGQGVRATTQQAAPPSSKWGGWLGADDEW